MEGARIIGSARCLQAAFAHAERVSIIEFAVAKKAQLWRQTPVIYSSVHKETGERIVKLQAAFIAFFLSSTAAFAADLAPAPVEPAAPIDLPYSWTGFYIGANGGYDWSRGTSGTVLITPPGGPVIARGGQKIDSKGWLAGGQVGYNQQWGNLVIGAEGDFDWSGAKGHKIPDPQNGAIATLITGKERWVSTVRGRVGYAFDRILVYGTGGLALADGNLSATRLISSTDSPRSDSNTHVGGTLGAGVEWAFADHWSVKVEYLHAWFAKEKYNLNTSGGPLAAWRVSTNINLDSDIVRAGINYKF